MTALSVSKSTGFPLSYRLVRLASAAVMCSAVRRASAAMVSVGFEVPIVGKLPEPTT